MAIESIDDLWLEEKDLIKINPAYTQYISTRNPTVLFVSEIDSVSLEGPIYVETVMSLAKSWKSVGKICDVLCTHSTLEEIWFALGQLKAKNLILCRRESGTFRHAPLWWARQCPSYPNSRNPLPVHIQNFSAATTDSFKRNLEKLHVVESKRPAAIIAIVDDYLDRRLHELQLRLRHDKISLFLVRLIGLASWIGPMFNWAESGCCRCLGGRVAMNRPVETLLRVRMGTAFKLKRAILPTAIELASALAAAEFVRYFAANSTNVADPLMIKSLDHITLQVDQHRFTPPATCPVCRDTDSLPSKGLSLVDRKVIETDGGLRTETAEETFARLSHLVSPITGIAPSLTKIATLPRGLHAYFAGHNLAIPNNEYEEFLKHARLASGGKGRSDMQARTSALCEAIERYSGVFQGNEVDITSSLNELGTKAIHPNMIMQFSSNQYLNRVSAPSRGFNRVPKEFDPLASIPWTQAYSLTARFQDILVPTALIYYAPPLGTMPLGYDSCLPDSNGCAAGAQIEDAILQGLLELVERDSVAIWWYNMLPKPCLDLQALKSPYVDSLLSAYTRLGREVWVLDVTTTLQIPSFVAVSRSLNDKEQILLGFGAHLDTGIAVHRALGELSQFLPKVITDKGRVYSKEEIQSDEIAHWLHTATLDKNQYLKPQGRIAPDKVSTILGHVDSLNNVLECIQLIVERLARERIAVYAVDQTRVETGLPVCKVLAPGLRHFWARYAPGRLYEEPVRTGALCSPSTESRLNPIPMFL